MVDTAEIHPGVEFPPYRLDVASALVLPLQTAQSSQTERGDRLIICLENEIEGQVAPVNRPAPEPDAMNPSFADGNFLETVPLNEIELSQSSGGNSLVAAPLLSVAAAVDEPVSVSFSFATGHSDIAKRGNGTGDSLTVFGDQCVEPNAVETARGGLSHVNGHGRGVEDLFANWVDAPSLSAAWIARNAEIEEDGISSFVHSRIDLPPLVPAEPSKIANAANDSQPSCELPFAARACRKHRRISLRRCRKRLSSAKRCCGCRLLPVRRDCYSSASASDKLAPSPSTGCGR